MTDIKSLRLLFFCLYFHTIFGDSYYQKTTIKTTSIITSPNYPRNYPPNTTYEWEVTDEEKIGKWHLIFLGGIQLEKSIRCEKDYLLIEDPYHPEASVLGKLCGPMTSVDPIMSSGPKLKITFRSDGHNQTKGFKIKIQYMIDYEGKEKIKEMNNNIKGVTAVVVHHDHPKDGKQKTLFIALVSVLSVAVAVFISLLICLGIGIYNRRRRQTVDNPPHVIRHVFKKPGTNNQTPKRYSRPSITERQDSFPLTHNPNAPRAVLLSTGSRRYVPV